MARHNRGIVWLLNSFWLVTFLACTGGLVALALSVDPATRTQASTRPPYVPPTPAQPNQPTWPNTPQQPTTPSFPNSPTPPSTQPSRVVLPVVVRRPTDDDPLIPTTPTIPVSTPAPEGMVLIAGGTFSMGSDGSSFPADRPAHEVRVDPYFMDKVEVTNAQFQQFVNATRYQTHAEKQGWSIVFDARVGQYEAVSGASWKSPEGPNSNIIGREQLPVVHVSWHDAAAYARWAGKRLPTEAEWEFAARGGYMHASFPWGRDLLVDGRYQANTWQGEFPKQDLGRDGFRSLAPVATYAPNHFGLYDMSGNVWEWCGDWYEENLYATRVGRVTENPTGPADGFLKAQRGGSYLSAESNAPAFTVFGRMASDPTSTFPHLGFRCVRDANAMARR